MTYKILIVDDSKLARMSVAKLLSSLKPDWTRLEAANAEDAMKMLTDSQPDVVLLDFNMPGRDGLDVADELQKRNPFMPVAVISANVQVEIVNRARDAGASFLSKPLTEQALAEFLTDAERRLAVA
jgi:CheY-like chemotaxis protein